MRDFYLFFWAKINVAIAFPANIFPEQKFLLQCWLRTAHFILERSAKKFPLLWVSVFVVLFYKCSAAANQRINPLCLTPKNIGKPHKILTKTSLSVWQRVQNLSIRCLSHIQRSPWFLPERADASKLWADVQLKMSDEQRPAGFFDDVTIWGNDTRTFSNKSISEK